MSKVLRFIYIVSLLCVHILSAEHGKKKEDIHHGPTVDHSKDGKHNEEYDHEAILGDHEKAEEYKHLVPAEAKKRLGQLVDLMDTNTDGFVTAKELSDWVHKSFTLLDKDESKRQFEETNKDKNVGVSWKEYLDKMYGYSLEEIKDFEKDKSDEMVNFMQMVQFDKKKFGVADVNKDSYLDLKEYDSFLHPQEYKHMIDIELERTLADHDKNNDSKISYEEFTGEHKQDSAEDRIAERQHFDEYDKNNDGVLSKDELKQWALPSFDETSVEEAKHLIREADKDRDGKLTKNEIVDAHEVFVGSQATDYGNHLETMMREDL